MRLPAETCFHLAWCHRLLLLSLMGLAASESPAQALVGNAAARSATPALAPAFMQADRLHAPTLRLPLNANVALSFQPGPWRRDDPLAALAGPGPGPTGYDSLGLEFKAQRRTDGARNLLRVQLAGSSVLHFRPRAGSLYVTYRSQF